jgi:hypothetical protein
VSVSFQCNSLACSSVFRCNAALHGQLVASMLHCPEASAINSLKKSFRAGDGCLFLYYDPLKPKCLLKNEPECLRYWSFVRCQYVPPTCVQTHLNASCCMFRCRVHQLTDLPPNCLSHILLCHQRLHSLYPRAFNVYHPFKPFQSSWSPRQSMQMHARLLNSCNFD